MRNAGHVLQATANTDVPIKGMAFQEYHPDFPHKQYTMGFAGMSLLLLVHRWISLVRKVFLRFIDGKGADVDYSMVVLPMPPS